MTTQAESLGKVAPDIPSPVVDLVDRALRYDKHERFTDAREMRRALWSAYEELCGNPLDSTPISFPIVERSPSARSDVPTMAEGDSAQRPSTARPVATPRPERPQGASRPVLAVVALVAIVASVWMIVRAGETPSPPPPSGAAEPKGTLAAPPEAPQTAAAASTAAPATSAGAGPRASAAALPEAGATPTQT